MSTVQQFEDPSCTHSQSSDHQEVLDALAVPVALESLTSTGLSTGNSTVPGSPMSFPLTVDDTHPTTSMSPRDDSYPGTPMSPSSFESPTLQDTRADAPVITPPLTWGPGGGGEEGPARGGEGVREAEIDSGDETDDHTNKRKAFEMLCGNDGLVPYSEDDWARNCARMKTDYGPLEQKIFLRYCCSVCDMNRYLTSSTDDMCTVAESFLQQRNVRIAGLGHIEGGFVVDRKKYEDYGEPVSRHNATYIMASESSELDYEGLGHLRVLQVHHQDLISREKHDLETRASASDKEVLKLRGFIAEMSERADDLQGQIATCETEAGEKEQEIEAILADKERFRKEYFKICYSRAAEVLVADECNQDLEICTRKLRSQGKHIEWLEENARNLEQSLSETGKALHSISGEVSSLFDSIKVKDDQHAQLLNGFRDFVEASKVQTAAHEARHTRMTQYVATLRGNMKALSKQPADEQ